MKINKKILFLGFIGVVLLTGCGSSNSSSNQEGEGYKRLDSNLETIPEKKVVDKYYAMKFEQPYMLYSSIISDVKMDYSEAVGFCSGLKIGEKEVAWRLPDTSELERLAPYSRPNNYFWSSESGYDGNYKIVNLKTGDICNDTSECRNDYNYVVCVSETQI